MEGHFESLDVKVIDDNFSCSGKPGHLAMHHTDWTRADDQHVLSGTHTRFFVSVEDARHRLDEGGLSETYMVSNRKYISLLDGHGGDANKFGEGAILMNAQRAVIWI